MPLVEFCKTVATIASGGNAYKLARRSAFFVSRVGLHISQSAQTICTKRLPVIDIVSNTSPVVYGHNPNRVPSALRGNKISSTKAKLVVNLAVLLVLV